MINAFKNKSHSGNVKMIVLSLVLAVGVWIAVNYVNNPDIETTVSGLKVMFAGETELRERGFVITGKSSIPAAAVVVSGKRGELIENADKIHLEADVSGITAEGEYTLTGNIVLPTTRITVEKEKYGQIPIKVEKLCEKEIPVKLEQTGTLKDKLVKSELLNTTVTLTGSQSELDNVSYGIANINITNLTGNNRMTVKYLLLNNTGSYIEKNETIESATAEVMVKNTVYPKKTLPVKLTLSDEMEASYVLYEDKCTLMTTSVEVGVLPSNTDECVYAVVDSTDDSNGYTLRETEGMYIPEEFKKIRAKLSITKLSDWEAELEPSAENVPMNMQVSVDKVKVKVRAAEDKLNTDNIKAHVDVKNMDEGTYTLPVVIEGDTVRTSETYYTTVRINRRRD